MREPLSGTQVALIALAGLVIFVMFKSAGFEFGPGEMPAYNEAAIAAEQQLPPEIDAWDDTLWQPDMPGVMYNGVEYAPKCPGGHPERDSYRGETMADGHTCVCPKPGNPWGYGPLDCQWR